MRKKSDYTIALKDFYPIYANNNKGIVDYTTYSNVINAFNKELIHLLIYESEEVKLPSGLGTLRIKKKKIKLGPNMKLIPNWGETNKLWAENPKAKEEKKLVFFLNEHRGGYNYKIYWDKSKAKIKNKSFYYFIPARAFKRELASVLKNNFEIDYYL